MNAHSENGTQAVAPRNADFAVLAARIRVAPFHQWLAVELESAKPGEVVVLAKWRDEMRSRLDPPIMHGGIVAALLDLAGLYAVLAGGQGSRARPICMSTITRRYRPAPCG
jgi:acyl-coenzyme A thioesterase PaaI-like protein